MHDQPRRISPAEQLGSQQLAGMLQDAESALQAQRRTLERLGAAIPDTSPTIPHYSLGSSAPDDVMRLLRLSLTEIATRQMSIEAAMPAHSFAMDALVSAMHRVRTTIDVALGCSEEAAELSSEPDVAAAARESASALRLIYHFANELNDLADVNGLLALDARELIDCDEVLSDVIANLSSVARDANCKLVLVAQFAPLKLSTHARLLRRTLSYLVLNALASSSVRTVTCGVDGEATDPNGSVTFRICDDGDGAGLVERSNMATYGALLKPNASQPSADASGFGVARRLAHALGGRIELETRAQGGSTLLLHLPR